MTDASLAGTGVLVTRPRAQTSELADAIERLGGHAISFPVIEIVPRDQTAVAADAAHLPQPDIVIFVSSNAVNYGLNHAAGAAKAAIGPATAAAIRAAGQVVDIEPVSGHDSESLLAEPLLQDITGKAVRIVRGNPGRGLLASTLRKRGATVNHLSVYERQLPEISSDALHKLETAWRAGTIQVITVMSVETLHNLIAVLPESCIQDLQNVALVTPAVRVIKEAQKRCPAARPLLAAGIRVGDMVEAIVKAAMTTQETDSGQVP